MDSFFKKSVIFFKIFVEIGMSSKHRFTFYGDGDHERGKSPGDVIIQVRIDLPVNNKMYK